MKKFEVLAPAGDINNFYEAIKSGADAVYLGLDKFNARMKAENIGIDKLVELIKFAHMKDVSVYITLNTLVSDAEMKDIVSLVGEAINTGVDAFIVQDYGIISVLKKAYPQVVLHGSTQLGVHNRYGAQVAKELGLSRVVLSRETTLEDIKDIKNNVDIELEVFVHGAMCICFSGNCYFSSLKFGASGNRGECKQLCRLPYTLADSSREKTGYVLSPRDNCMLSYLRELCKLGVESFKIEGRLRRKGYVAVATSTYRQAIDSILESQDFADYRNERNQYLSNQGLVKVFYNEFDENIARKNLQKVFSRGEFVTGYIEGNDVVDINTNNHIGQLIGRVIDVKPFKDIYKIKVESSEELHAGDGLKFEDDGQYVSLGVGNIDNVDNKYIIYGKIQPKLNTKVYRAVDYEYENNIGDYSCKRVLEIKVNGFVGNKLNAIVKCGTLEVCAYGQVCDKAKSRPITKENIIEQFRKVGELYQIKSIDIELDDDVFLPLSSINELRRNIIAMLEERIFKTKAVEFQNVSFVNNYQSSDLKLAIIDEGSKININDYDSLILSPKNYSVTVVENFYNNYKSKFSHNLFLNLPIIAMVEDLKIIDKIVEYAKSKEMILIANNIYGLYYISKGAKVWAGVNMNVANNYSYNALMSLGCDNCVASIEKWHSGVKNAFKMCAGRRVLMTMVNCPYKTLNRGLKKPADCSNCSKVGSLKLLDKKYNYKIRRYVISNCYFELVDDYIYSGNSNKQIDDLRE